jgi:glycosyltransferase involved in cell wall biosynthesis
VKWLARQCFRLAGIHVPDPNTRLPLNQAFFTSQALRNEYAQASIQPATSRVIYWGIQVERFAAIEGSQYDPGRLLFAGNVRREKGVHTAIEALHLLDQRGHGHFTLDIVGGSMALDYLRQIRRRVEDLRLSDRVRFLGPVPHDSMPDIYRGYGILLFPSIWKEPFALTILEAMASGLAVVSTARGGSAEILKDGQNALVFTAEDHQDLADNVQLLWNDRELYDRVRLAGRQLVQSQYTLVQMVDRIEDFIEQTIRRSLSEG